MALITRTYTFTDGTVAYGSQVDSEIANIVNTMNNLDSGATTWTNVKVTTLLPQADVNAGGHKITNLATPTTSGDAVPLSYLQANYTTTTSLVGTRILQIVQSTTTSGASVSSSTFTTTNLTASITPSATTSKIRISVMGPFINGSPNSSVGSLTIKRGATNLGDATYGFWRYGAGPAGTTTVPVYVSYIDSPSTTSATTYTVFISSSDNASGMTFPVGGVTAYISLEEIG